MEKDGQRITNKYTQEYEEFRKIPESERLDYNKMIHQAPLEDTDLELPQCNPTYYSKVPASGETHLNLTTYVWETPHQPKNILFINHGLNGTVGSYQHLAENISQHTPTVVIGHDARHFGRSDGIPRGLVYSPTRLLEDLEKVVEWGVGKYGQNLNIFLMGLSMGGRVATEVATRKKFPYKGAILVVPALIKSPISLLKLGWKDYFKVAFMPESGVASMSYTNSCRHSEFIQNKIKTNPYIYQGPLLAGTVRSFGAFYKEAEEVIRKFDLPYLFIQASVDKLIDPFQVRDFQKWSKSSDKTHYFSNQMWHSCCFDREFLAMTPEILRWMNARTQ